jgi:N-acetyl-beta-hexosaminidase
VEKIVQTLGKRLLGWEDIDDIEFIAFPRMADIAEISWSPAGGRSWQEVRPRLDR